MGETTLTDEVTDEQLKRYREKIAAARGRTKPRPIGPASANMPTPEEMEAMMDRPDGGEVQLSGKEIAGLASSPDPTARLSVPPRAGLRKETVEGLAALAKSNAGVPPPDESGDEDAVGPEEDDDLDDDIARMESLLGSRKEVATQVHSIYNKERRVAIEAKLAKIDIALVLTNQDVVQRVDIAEGASITYRSLNGLETEFVPRYIWERYKGELTYEMNELAKSLVSLTLTIVGVTGRELPEHRTKKGGVDTPSFERKWSVLLKYPGFLLEAMDINRVWFLERCASSLKVEDLGNG